VVADTILTKSEYRKIRAGRYASYEGGEGAAFEGGGVPLEKLRDYAIAHGEPAVISGRQEYMENLINRFI
jgi:xylose isomerase